MEKKENNQYNLAGCTDRLLKYGITIKYAAGVASEMSNLESYCASKFISKAEISDIIKHHFVRIESKLSAARVESLKWYIGMSLVQISGVVSAVIAMIEMMR